MACRAGFAKSVHAFRYASQRVARIPAGGWYKGEEVVRFLFVCTLALMGAVAAPASAKALNPEQAKQWEFKPESFTCPLTGKRFKQVVTHPHFPLESYPDGSHPGDEWIDTQIPECPQDRVPILPDYAASMEGEDAGSGRLVYHTYTAEELARIPGLIASEEWTALLSQTRHQRAYWLAKQLGRPSFDRFELLLHSPWSAENDEQKRTALEVLINDLPAIADDLDAPPEYRVFARYYMVDALRQLARFDEALALLDLLDKQVVDAEPGEDPDWAYARGEYSLQQARAIKLKDSDRFAIEALDDRIAGRLCSDPASYPAMRGPNAARSCKAREERLAREDAERGAVRALLDDRAALDMQCDDAAPDARDAILDEACRQAQHEADWAKGERLVREQPEQVAAICEAAAEPDRNTVQVSACTSYDFTLGYAVAELLDADDAAFAALCDVGTQLGYGAISHSCKLSSERRDYRRAVDLWQDQASLRNTCRRDRHKWSGDDYEHRDHALWLACNAQEDGEKASYWLDSYGEEGASDPSPLHRAALPYARKAIDTELARRAAQPKPSDPEAE
ncbi:MAG: hypothetical protein R3D99_02960 [Altererythrobacter sp.]